MEADPFAAFRRRDTGVSTSFIPPSVTPTHDPGAGATRQKPQKSAVETRVTPKTPFSDKRAEKTPAEAGSVTVAGIRERDNDALPRVWRDGLNKLNAMAVPSRASVERWREIVIDAHRFAWSWHRDAADRGWSLGSLVGYVHDQPDDLCGIVIDIRGGRCVNLGKDHRGRDTVSILDRDGGYRWICRRMPDDAPLIWDLLTTDARR